MPVMKNERSESLPKILVNEDTNYNDCTCKLNVRCLSSRFYNIEWEYIKNNNSTILTSNSPNLNLRNVTYAKATIKTNSGDILETFYPNLKCPKRNRSYLDYLLAGAIFIAASLIGYLIARRKNKP